MNKFFFPTTLMAVLVIATVFAFVPVEEAQTLHLPTIGTGQIADGSIVSADLSAAAGITTGQILDNTITNADFAAGVIPITTTVTIDTAATGAGGGSETLAVLTLPTFTGTSDILVTVTASVTPNALATNYEITLPAGGAGVDCGAGDNAEEVQRMFTTANTLLAAEVNVTTQFLCSGLTSAGTLNVGHNTAVNVVTANNILVTAIAVPT